MKEKAYSTGLTVKAVKMLASVACLLILGASPSKSNNLASGVVDADSYPSLHAALQAIGREKATLQISSAQVLLQDAVVHSGIRLEFHGEGSIVSSGWDLTIHGRIAAGNNQIFEMLSGGQLTIGSGCVEANVAWWGKDLSTALPLAVQATHQPTSIKIPVGNHDVQFPIVLDLEPQRSLALLGESKATISSTILEPLNSIDMDTGEKSSKKLSVLLVRGNSTNRVRIEGLSIVHHPPSERQGNIAGIEVENVGESRVRDCRVTGTTSQGIIFRGVGRGSISECESHHNNLTGISLRSSSNITIQGNHVWSNGHYAPWASGADRFKGYGIACGTGNPTNTNIVISNNQVRDSFRKGIDVHAGHGVVISNNQVDGFHLIGIYADSTSNNKDVRDVLVTGNRIKGYGVDTLPRGWGRGIHVGAISGEAPFSGSFIIANNLIRDVRRGIHVNTPESPGIAPRRVVISGNNISSVYNENIPNEAVIVVGTTDNGPRVLDVAITGNSVHADLSRKCVLLRRVSNAVVSGKTFRMDDGTIPEAVTGSSGCRIALTANHFDGDATYQTVHSSNNNQVRATTNFLKGTPLADQ